MSDEFSRALSGGEEIRITFTKKDGKKRTIPIWFVLDGGKLKLLPMYGLRTKWYQDVERTGSMVVRAKEQSKPLTPTVVKDQKAIDNIVDEFAKKYGASSRRYYATQDVALVMDL